MLEQTGISIWRDHDHMHVHNPDGIFTGVLKYLGWENYAWAEHGGGGFTHFHVHLPEPITVANLCSIIKDKINLNGLRYIGDADALVQKLAIVGHLYPQYFAKKDADGRPIEYSVEIIKTLEEQVDVILPGEIIEWTVLSYVRDAVQQGKAKAVINIGHFNWEELGMKYAQEWVSELVGSSIPVTYLPSEDMYSYI